MGANGTGNSARSAVYVSLSCTEGTKAHEPAETETNEDTRLPGASEVVSLGMNWLCLGFGMTSHRRDGRGCECDAAEYVPRQAAAVDDKIPTGQLQLHTTRVEADKNLRLHSHLQSSLQTANNFAS